MMPRVGEILHRGKYSPPAYDSDSAEAAPSPVTPYGGVRNLQIGLKLQTQAAQAEQLAKSVQTEGGETMIAECATCGNQYDKAFQVTTADGESSVFDSFECAISGPSTTMRTLQLPRHRPRG